jgi:hypothetical protein
VGSAVAAYVKSGALADEGLHDVQLKQPMPE